MLPPPWSTWQYLILAAEASGVVVSFSVVFMVAHNVYWAAILALAYLAAGLPLAYKVNSSLEREWKLVESLWSFCRGSERHLLGGPSRLAYCIDRSNTGLRIICLNATYGVLGFFKGHIVPAPQLSRDALVHRDFTCIKNLKGALKVSGKYKIFRGLAVIPHPEAALTVEVKGAMVELAEPTSIGEELSRLTSIVGEPLE